MVHEKELIFSKNIIEKATQPLSLWEKFRLLFRPKNYSVDSGIDGICKVTFKELNGKVYILDILYFTNS